MQGRRCGDSCQKYYDAQPGDYWRDFHEPQRMGAPDAERGRDFFWTIKDPRGQLGTLLDHEVIEHEDGTITVSPSIWDAPNGYHGWLRAGEWTDA